MGKRVFHHGCPEWDKLVACAMQLPGQDPAYKKLLLRDTLRYLSFQFVLGLLASRVFPVPVFAVPVFPGSQFLVPVFAVPVFTRCC
ncbi:MAG: hypothetical protein K8S55_06385 [Phycisphaerae bacterium]|nr:hypothetical protein [Phycisphaerae bacterium]